MSSPGERASSGGRLGNVCGSVPCCRGPTAGPKGYSASWILQMAEEQSEKACRGAGVCAEIVASKSLYPTAPVVVRICGSFGWGLEQQG